MLTRSAESNTEITLLQHDDDDDVRHLTSWGSVFLEGGCLLKIPYCRAGPDVLYVRQNARSAKKCTQPEFRNKPM